MFEISVAQPQDAARLAEFAKKTFCETFAPYNSESDMAMYTQKTFGPAKQLSEITDPQNRIVLAHHGEELIGYYMLSTASPDPCVRGAQPIQLCRLYVDSRWHGKKVAQRLLEEAMERSRQEGFQTFWMGVWEKNLRALAFYKKWDFTEVGELTFQLGEDRQRDVIFSRSI